jgi:WD40 repeat protein
VRLFSLLGPPQAEPLVLQKGDTNSAGQAAFDGAGRWLATTHGKEVAFWPLDTPRAQMFRTPDGPAQSIVFAPDGNTLLSLCVDRSVRAWPLRAPDGETRFLHPATRRMPVLQFMSLSSSGRVMAVSGAAGSLAVVRLDGRASRPLQGQFERNLIGRPAFSDDDQLLAAGVLGGPRDQKVIRVWDLGTGSVRVFGPLPTAGDMLAGGFSALRFVGRERLLAAVLRVGLVSVDLTSGTSRVLVAQPIGDFALSRGGRFGVGTTSSSDGAERGSSPAIRFDLVTGTAQRLSSHGTDVSAVALDPSGSVVATGSSDGTIRIGRVSGKEPHLLLGQEGAIYSLAFSPDGRWLAAAGEAFAIHIFPVPDLSRTPLHRRPHDALLTALRSHTNLRAVPDSSSATGYRLTPDPLPGWRTVPEW